MSFEHMDSFKTKMELAEDNEKLRSDLRVVVEALERIAMVGGNMGDERLTDKTGPNDAAHRGIMYCEARRLAKEALIATRRN